ncbi:MAG: hypothetical protein ATN31_02455 [Candidatus Epulonipiscioides saccharophilum]|nr:MAG: hypothetical protein ATN31_02455 [Epulopiscium sp. AS2M-Bin001]
MKKFKDFKKYKESSKQFIITYKNYLLIYSVTCLGLLAIGACNTWLRQEKNENHFDHFYDEQNVTENINTSSESDNLDSIIENEIPNLNLLGEDRYSTAEGRAEILKESIIEPKAEMLELDYFSNANKDNINVELANLGLNFINILNPEANLTVSPVSIAYALGMTSNGAQNNTLAQVEQLLGANLHSLNAFCERYINLAQESEQIKLANSIWFNENKINISDPFLQVNKDCYSAEMYDIDFNSQTNELINHWAEEKTNGQLTDLMKDPIDMDTAMVLVNALAFEDSWLKPYGPNEIYKNNFNLEDGTIQLVDFLHSNEDILFVLGNGEAVGIVKPYQDDKHSFVAITSDQSIHKFLKDVNIEDILTAIENPIYQPISVQLPKFNFSCNMDLKNILSCLGVTDAFDSTMADFSKMTAPKDNSFYIGQAIHSTVIDVNENGSSAAAGSAIAIMNRSMPMPAKYEVAFNKPFFFMIMDDILNLPVFMGVLNYFEDIPVGMLV